MHDSWDSLEEKWPFPVDNQEESRMCFHETAHIDCCRWSAYYLGMDIPQTIQTNWSSENCASKCSIHSFFGDISSPCHWIHAESMQNEPPFRHHYNKWSLVQYQYYDSGPTKSADPWIYAGSHSQEQQGIDSISKNSDLHWFYSGCMLYGNCAEREIGDAFPRGRFKHDYLYILFIYWWWKESDNHLIIQKQPSTSYHCNQHDVSWSRYIWYWMSYPMGNHWMINTGYAGSMYQSHCMQIIIAWISNHLYTSWFVGSSYCEMY